MKRWHHGHSIGAGVLVGLGLASYRVWLLMAACVLLGAAVTLLVVYSSRMVAWIRDMVWLHKRNRQDEQTRRLRLLHTRKDREKLDRQGFPRGY